MEPKWNVKFKDYFEWFKEENVLMEPKWNVKSRKWEVISGSVRGINGTKVECKVLNGGKTV